MNYQAFKRLGWPPTPWLIPGLLTGGRGIIYGRPKAGKSVAAVQIAHALHTATPLWGFPAPDHPRKVLYVQVDAPASEMMQQVTDMGLGDTLDIGIAHFEHPDPKWRVDPHFLSSPGATARLATLARAYAPDFIVWDGLTYLDYTTDMNRREGVVHLLERLRSLYHCPCLIVAHSNKDREAEGRGAVDRVAGSGAIAGAANYGIMVERENNVETGTFGFWGRVAGLPASLSMSLRVGSGWTRRQAARPLVLR